MFNVLLQRAANCEAYAAGVTFFHVCGISFLRSDFGIENTV